MTLTRSLSLRFCMAVRSLKKSGFDIRLNIGDLIFSVKASGLSVLINFEGFLNSFDKVLINLVKGIDVNDGAVSSFSGVDRILFEKSGVLLKKRVSRIRDGVVKVKDVLLISKPDSDNELIFPERDSVE